MTLLLRGKTLCAICERPIQESDDADGFPSFVIDPADPLYIFSDAAVHSGCFKLHPLRNKVTQRLQLIDNLMVNPPTDAKCMICSQPMDSFDNYYPLPFLVEEVSDPLYKFNCNQLHRNCIKRWHLRIELCTLLRKRAGLIHLLVIQRILEDFDCKSETQQ